MLISQTFIEHLLCAKDRLSGFEEYQEEKPQILLLNNIESINMPRSIMVMFSEKMFYAHPPQLQL